MRQEYDNYRGGWVQYDDDNEEIGFTKDMNAWQNKLNEQNKKKNKKRNRARGSTGAALILFVVIGTVILTLLTQPMLIIIPAVLFFIYKKYNGTPGTMGMIASFIKYAFILYLAYLIVSGLIGMIF